MTLTNEDIARIGRGVRDRTLPKAQWTHAAHLAAALHLLDAHGLAGAEERMPGVIQRYNEATGVPNTDHAGYHHTITLASLRTVHARMGEGSAAVRLARLLALGMDRSDWLLAHYTRERLFSAAARRGWVEPDLAPLAAPTGTAAPGPAAAP